MQTLKISAAEENKGERLDKFIADNSDISRSYAANIIVIDVHKSGCVGFFFIQYITAQMQNATEIMLKSESFPESNENAAPLF